jgi:hypothetical protein
MLPATLRVGRMIGVYYIQGGWNSLVGIATGYGQDGPGIESQLGVRMYVPSRPAPRLFPGGK